jgi:tRNA(fMet)-specific endonuclease VapC
MSAAAKSNALGSFLLDTNACIALINGKPPSVRNRLTRRLDEGSQIFVSTISALELWYGVEKSTSTMQDLNVARLEFFFSGPLRLLSFEDEDARVAGTIRATLDKLGTPIGAYDLLIGAQALRNKMSLVTSSEREFRRIPSLAWEDWAKSGA